MKLIHVSDRHYGEPGTTTANARINNALCARDDIVDCIIIDTGDVVDSPTPSVYRTATDAQRELAGACHRLLHTPGNHDFDWMGLMRSPAAPAMWGHHVEQLSGWRPTYPSIHVDGGMAIILADTNRTPTTPVESVRATGLVGADQIEDVAAMVRRARSFDLPVILAMHHCPSGGDPLLRLGDRHALGEALEAAGGVDLMLTGHLHEKREWSYVFGARFLLSSSKTPDAQGYREIWWDEGAGRFRWEWVSVS